MFKKPKYLTCLLTCLLFYTASRNTTVRSESATSVKSFSESSALANYMTSSTSDSSSSSPSKESPSKDDSRRMIVAIVGHPIPSSIIARKGLGQKRNTSTMLKLRSYNGSSTLCVTSSSTWGEGSVYIYGNEKDHKDSVQALFTREFKKGQSNFSKKKRLPFSFTKLQQFILHSKM